jgi:hypothetical protein
MKFFRHRADGENRLERMIDLGAAELAFPATVYGARVAEVGHRDPTWDLVKLLQHQFAHTSSLLSAAKAFVRFWPQPVFLLTAALRPSKQRPLEAPALRIHIEGFNASAEKSGVHFIHNMRVPLTSPISLTYTSSLELSAFENLGNWTTRGGTQLPNRRALTSSVRLGSIAYAIVSLV